MLHSHCKSRRFKSCRDHQVKNKIIFCIFWIVLLFLSPITVFAATPISSITDRTMVANVAQRLIGLWAYTLLFVQIILGTFMTRWIEKFGAWVFKFHVFEGLLIYALIFLHPLTFTFFYYFIGKGFDPFYTFVDVCVICKKDLEFSYNFGRISFWLITVAVLTGLFRAATPFLRMHWHKFHILNYVAFFTVYYHSLRLGSDVGTFPFSVIHTPAALIILGIVLFKLYSHLKKGNL